MNKLVISSFLLVVSSLNANDENILSKDKLKSFELSKKKVIEDTNKLKKDWINPINIRYTRKNDKNSGNSTQAMISVNQPIFKSGGIYRAIKYAQVNEEYANLDIRLQKKALIQKAYNLLFSIYENKLEIKKSTLLLKNAEIDVVRKKEQVINGILDASYLDNAILKLNTTKKNLIDLEYNEKDLINNFNNIASKNYKSFKLPVFKIITKENFIKQNLELSKVKSNIEVKNELKGMKVSQYLPSLSVAYNYIRNYNISSLSKTPQEVQNVGISVSIPIDVKTFNDIQSAQIDYLQAKLAFKDKVLEEKNFFKSTMAKIQGIKEKIKITRNDAKLYQSLLNTVKEEENAGLKTQSDFNTLLNSSKIKQVEIKIFKIQKQKELLNLYSKLKK